MPRVEESSESLAARCRSSIVDQRDPDIAEEIPEEERAHVENDRDRFISLRLGVVVMAESCVSLRSNSGPFSKWTYPLAGTFADHNRPSPMAAQKRTRRSLAIE